jgi:hypothetical protein
MPAGRRKPRYSHVDQAAMMRICNTKNEFVFKWVEFSILLPWLNTYASKGGREMFWQLLLLFVVTCGIALVGQRLLERSRSRGNK